MRMHNIKEYVVVFIVAMVLGMILNRLGVPRLIAMSITIVAALTVGRIVNQIFFKTEKDD